MSSNKTTQDKIMDKYLEKTEYKTNTPTVAKDNKYSQSGKFNEALFNTDFQEKITEQIKYAETIETQKLNEINNYYIYELKEKEKISNDEITISKFLVNWNDNIRNIIVDIMLFNYNFSEFIQIFTKDNRIFYVGLTVVTIFTIYYFIKSYFFYTDNICEQKSAINNYIYKSDIDSNKLKEMEKVITNNVSREIGKDMTNNVSIEMINNVSKEMGKDMSKEMINNVSKETNSNILDSISNSSGGYIFAEKSYFY